MDGNRELVPNCPAFKNMSLSLSIPFISASESCNCKTMMSDSCVFAAWNLQQKGVTAETERGRNKGKHCFLSWRKMTAVLVEMSIKWLFQVRLETTAKCWKMFLYNMCLNSNKDLYLPLLPTSRSLPRSDMLCYDKKVWGRKAKQIFFFDWEKPQNQNECCYFIHFSLEPLPQLAPS